MNLLKIPEVSERLRLSLSATYGLIETGALASIAVGNRKALRVSEDDLQAFLDSRRRGRGPAPAEPQRNPRSPLKHLKL
jgi:excisionase family DNA binding protein